MTNALQLQVVPLPDESRNEPCCRLACWSLRVSPSPHGYGATVLIGRVLGHPELADDSEIVTSPLCLIVRTEAADLAYTNTAVYELGVAHPDLIAALLEPD